MRQEPSKNSPPIDFEPSSGESKCPHLFCFDETLEIDIRRRVRLFTKTDSEALASEMPTNYLVSKSRGEESASLTRIDQLVDFFCDIKFAAVTASIKGRQAHKACTLRY